MGLSTKDRTPRQRIVEDALGCSIVEWVDAMNEDGELSWRRLAVELTNQTDEYVTYESLRKWYLRAGEAMPT